jgi:hypothetical protein
MDPKAEEALKPFLTKVIYFFIKVTGITLRSAGIFASQGRLLMQECICKNMNKPWFGSDVNGTLSSAPFCPALLLVMRMVFCRLEPEILAGEVA